MSLPTVRACIICDTVREEVGGKLTVLGMFGFAPDVMIHVRALPAQFELTFLLVFAKATKEIQTKLVPEVLNQQGETVVRFPEMSGKFEAGKGAIIAMDVRALQAKQAGEYRFRLLAEGKEEYSTTFRIKEGPVQGLP